MRVAHSVLARILDDAVKDRMLAANPARGVKLPKQAPPRNVYLSAAQLDMLASEAGPYRSLVLLLGVGGLRWGEAIALRVCDIDFLRRRIELHRNVVACAASSSSARSSEQEPHRGGARLRHGRVGGDRRR